MGPSTANGRAGPIAELRDVVEARPMKCPKYDGAQNSAQPEPPESHVVEEELEAKPDGAEREEEDDDIAEEEEEDEFVGLMRAFESGNASEEDFGRVESFCSKFASGESQKSVRTSCCRRPTYGVTRAGP